MKPTVGRIVHYVAYGTPGGEYPEGAHRAAVITATIVPITEPPNAVSLCVLNPTGLFFNLHVPYDDSPTPKAGTWHWPEREGDASAFNRSLEQQAQ